MSVAVRFYGSLNDFLPPVRRHATLVCSLAAAASVKDVIEALGVPHPEIDLIVVKGRAVDFNYRVADGDHVSVYPRFCSLDPGMDVRLSPPLQHPPRFVADVHLGRLAAYLRFAGFDTSYRNDYTDREIVTISSAEDRTVLTRDVGLLKHRLVTRGYFVRETAPARQLVELLQRFELAGDASPFSRCVRCNQPLVSASKAEIEHRLEPRTREHHDVFWQCPVCARVYWRGSHYARLSTFLDTAIAAATGRIGKQEIGNGK